MKNRSLPLCITLSIITFGIYYLYWVYSVSKEVIDELEYQKIDNPILNLVYMILTLTGYSHWWNYKISNYLTVIEKKNKIEPDFWAGPLSLIFNLVLHQSRINRILATQYSKKAVAAAARKKRAQKKIVDKED